MRVEVVIDYPQTLGGEVIVVDDVTGQIVVDDTTGDQVKDD